MNTVLRFQSSALRPGAKIAPINAKEPTVVAVLRNFISLFTSFDPNRSLLFAQVQREADLGGMFRTHGKALRGPFAWFVIFLWFALSICSDPRCAAGPLTK